MLPEVAAPTAIMMISISMTCAATTKTKTTKTKTKKTKTKTMKKAKGMTWKVTKEHRDDRVAVVPGVRHVQDDEQFHDQGQ